MPPNTLELTRPASQVHYHSDLEEAPQIFARPHRTRRPSLTGTRARLQLKITSEPHDAGRLLIPAFAS